MHKLFCFIIYFFFSSILLAQKTDSVQVFYKSDEFELSRDDRQAIDKFLSGMWDKITIRSYADVTDEDEYNLELSRTRAEKVYQYLTAKEIPSRIIDMHFFGETIQLANNETEEGRALNRRTTIIGYLYPRIAPKPKVDLSKPVTETIAGGVIVTYTPNNIPFELLQQFQSGVSFEMITNTREMRNANLYNNTSDGEILSSVMIFSGGLYNPCKLDTPIFIKIPVPFTDCPVDSIKFFAAVENNGVRIWQEKAMPIVEEIIRGQRYMGVWMDDFCGVYNFDYKIRPGCFDIDSMGLITTTNSIRNFSSELVGLNSVYLPRRSADSAYQIWYVKKEKQNANVSFALYNGKKVIRRFTNQPLSTFPYSEDTKKHILSTDTIVLRYSNIKDLALVLRVNKDVYRQFSEGNLYRFIYLNRANEKVVVDVYATGKRKKDLIFKNVPVSLLPFDEKTGEYRINKEVLRSLAVRQKEIEKEAAAKKNLSSR